MRLALLAVCATLAVAAVRGLSAQEPPAEIVVEIGDERFAAGTLTARVGGERCASVDLGAGERVLRLGLAGQPAACGVEGATITFYRSVGPGCPEACAPLFTTLTVLRGVRQTLINFAPVPPGTGGLGVREPAATPVWLAVAAALVAFAITALARRAVARRIE